MFERVKDIMTKGVDTRPRNADVKGVLELMARERYSQVPITPPDNPSEVLGLINESSVFAFVRGQGSTIEELLRPAPPRVSPHDFVDEELARMLKEHDLVLVYEDGHLTGIVTNSNLNKLIDYLEPYRIFPKLEQHLRDIARYLLAQKTANWILKRVIVPAQRARARTHEVERSPQTLDDTYFPDLVDALKDSKNQRFFQRKLRRRVREEAFGKMLNELEAVRGVRKDLAHSRPVDIDGLDKLRKAGRRVREVWMRLQTETERAPVSRHRDVEREGDRQQ